MSRVGKIAKAALQADLFAHVPQAPADPIIWTKIAYSQDSHAQKINLGVGAYRDDHGNPYIFNVVRKIEQEIASKSINHEYLEIDGLQEFVKGSRNLVLGAGSEAVRSGRVASTQTISGTGALNIGFEFLARYLPRIVYLSKPTWPIHPGIINKLHLQDLEYPYYCPKTKGFNCQAMLDFLGRAVPGSAVVLHACAHNPTGIDPTKDQWRRIAEVMKKRNLIPFFDSAYQGFATGDLEEDAWAVRHFLDEGFQMFVAQSFAKNMGLYGERVGALHVVSTNKEAADRILSQIKIIIRMIYSSPARHGATIAATILNTPQLYKEWQYELSDIVAKRMIEVRALLRAELQSIGAPGTWNHITDQIGMFSYSGLSQAACDILISKYHVYLLRSGRISMAGVNRSNVKYLATSMKAAIQQANL